MLVLLFHQFLSPFFSYMLCMCSTKKGGGTERAAAHCLPCTLPPQLSLSRNFDGDKVPSSNHKHAKVWLVERHFCKITLASVIFCISRHFLPSQILRGWCPPKLVTTLSPPPSGIACGKVSGEVGNQPTPDVIGTILVSLI